MKMPRFMICLACLFISFALFRCGSPIAKVYRQEAVPASFSAVYEDPEHYKGDTVVWGGSIIQTIPTMKGATIYILETELGSRDKPKASETSHGRFIAKTNLRLDPLIYSSGRKITVAGKVIGQEVQTNKKTGVTYAYPVVQVEQMHLWSIPEPYYPPAYWWGWGWGGYWGGPYWGGPFFEGHGGFEEGEHEEGEHREGEHREGGENR